MTVGGVFCTLIERGMEKVSSFHQNKLQVKTADLSLSIKNATLLCIFQILIKDLYKLNTLIKLINKPTSINNVLVLRCFVM